MPAVFRALVAGALAFICAAVAVSAVNTDTSRVLHTLRRRVQRYRRSRSHAEADTEADETQRQAVAVTPAGSAELKGTANYYLYPSSNNHWTDSTGLRYDKLRWGEFGAFDQFNLQNYANGNGPVFYHSSKSPLAWNAHTEPTLPMWMTVDLEQSVGLGAKTAVAAHGNNAAVYVHPIRIRDHKVLRLFPLPPCVDGGQRLLNQFLRVVLPMVHVPQFPNGLMGYNMDTAEGKELMRSVCQAFRSAKPTPYDGWRSPWDQDEMMLCPHALKKMVIPGMSLTTLKRGAVQYSQHGLRRCPKATLDQYRVVPTPQQNTVSVRGRPESLANVMRAYQGQQWAQGQGAVQANNDNGGQHLPVMGMISQDGTQTPMPPTLPPNFCPNGQTLRFAFYYRKTDQSMAPFDHAALTAPNACPLVDAHAAVNPTA